mmetsp:Transcript_22374/g.46662  ORF Transcript_22374/g.46662 Transcript_22374/m.46662 type:complete len:201 (-) Transcript_22374:285-887(-)
MYAASLRAASSMAAWKLATLPSLPTKLVTSAQVLDPRWGGTCDDKRSESDAVAVLTDVEDTLLQADLRVTGTGFSSSGSSTGGKPEDLEEEEDKSAGRNVELRRMDQDLWRLLRWGEVAVAPFSQSSLFSRSLCAAAAAALFKRADQEDLLPPSSPPSVDRLEKLFRKDQELRLCGPLLLFIRSVEAAEATEEVQEAPDR